VYINPSTFLSSSSLFILLNIFDFSLKLEGRTPMSGLRFRSSKVSKNWFGTGYDFFVCFF
jgi:hypothetical protein